MKLDWKNVGIIIGLVGGLISIPKSAIEGWRTIFGKPELEVWRSAPVSLTYDPKHGSLQCSFGVLLHNTGNRAEVINTLSAYFGLPDDPSRRVAFSGNDITLKEGANEIPKVLPIEQNMAKTLTCEINVALSDSMRDLFTQHETSRELVLDLGGENSRSYPAVFRFDVSENVTKLLFDSEGPPIRFIQFLDSDKK
jgi:hypothetical protein